MLNRIGIPGGYRRCSGMGRWEWAGKLGRLHGEPGVVLTEILGTGRSPRWAEIEEGGG